MTDDVGGHLISTWTRWGGEAGGGQKNSVFVHAQGIKTVHTRGGGEKKANFCPRSSFYNFLKCECLIMYNLISALSIFFRLFNRTLVWELPHLFRVCAFYKKCTCTHVSPMFYAAKVACPLLTVYDSNSYTEIILSHFFGNWLTLTKTDISYLKNIQ